MGEPNTWQEIVGLFFALMYAAIAVGLGLALGVKLAVWFAGPFHLTQVVHHRTTEAPDAD